MAVYVLFSALLLAVTSSGSAFDIDSEIEELKAMYGEHVPYKPDKHRCAAEIRDKRFLWGTSTYCHDKLGCFPKDGDFRERLVNFDPNSRETIDTKFTLFTRSNQQTGQRLVADKEDSIRKSLFNKNRPTKIIIHGFLESTSASWFTPMNQELLNYLDYNVINVDWGGLRASKTLYTQATANTRVVAAEIVYLLKTLVKVKSLDLDDVHIVGHSLGSHIAGYVGTNLTGSIGRITGLDPAEPYFQGYGIGVRLDPSDAKFVDIIHSDADSIVEVVKGEGGFGSSELSGHADFFPNGGEDQPNCKNGILTNVGLENDLYEGLKRFFACDHDRAVQYFIASVNRCQFKGIICSDYPDYLNGKCSISCERTDNCNPMGLHCTKPRVAGFKKYYLQTGDDTNYCAREMTAKVTIDRSSSEFAGAIDLTVTGSTGSTQSFKLNKDQNVMKAGAEHRYQLGLSTSLGNPVGVEVKWTRDVSWWNVVTKACGAFGFCTSSIKIHEVELTNGNGQDYYFCGSGRSYESGKSRYLFYSKNSCVNN